MTINPLATYPFPYEMAGITQITPFTVRDGTTYLRILEQLRHYVFNITPEFDKRFELIIEQFQEGITNAENTIVEKTAEWDRLFEEFMAFVVVRLEALNDVAFSNIIKFPDSKSRIELDKLYASKSAVESALTDLSENKVGINEFVVNVKDFGAIGDGVTNNTEAIQAAADFIAAKSGGKGGTLYFPDGAFVSHGNVFLTAGTHDYITVTGSRAAVLRKTIGSTNYCYFVGLAGVNRGPGSGLKGFRVEGVTARGDLANSVSLSIISGNRMKGTRIYGSTFIECSQNGHIIDAMGWDDTHISRNRFGGIKAVAGREYTEAIQVDSSVRSGRGWDDALTPLEVFDGTPTTNMRVDDNDFEPDTINGLTYPAQKPFGSHSWVDGRPHDGLIFSNNRVDGVIDSRSSSYPGIVCFVGAKNVEIYDNKVRNSKNTFVRFMGGSSAILSSDVDLPTITNKPATYPQNAQNVVIYGNQLDSIKPDGTGGSLIYIYGVATTKLMNIRVYDNEFNNCHSLLESYLVQLSQGVGIEVRGNKIRSCPGGFLSLQDSSGAEIISNFGDGGAYYIANVTRCPGLIVDRNDFKNYKMQLNIVNTSNPTVRDNTISVTEDIAAIRFTTGAADTGSIVVTGNVVQALTTVPSSSSHGIFVDDDYKTGIAAFNLARNYTSAIYVNPGISATANVAA